MAIIKMKENKPYCLISNVGTTKYGPQKTTFLTCFDEVGTIEWGIFWVRKGDKFGFMNELGVLICEPQYDEVYSFSIDGYAVVKLNGKLGCINTRGQELCKIEYDEFYGIRNDYAKFRKGNQILLVALRFYNYVQISEYSSTRSLWDSPTWYESPQYTEPLKKLQDAE